MLATSIVAAAVVLGAAPFDSASTAPAPLLTLEEAVRLAEGQNHSLAAASRQVDEANERTAALGTRRLPALRLDAFGGRVLNSPSLTVPAGSLGNVPGVGPFPTTSSPLSIPTDWNGMATVSLAQPLTQQYRIGLGLEASRLDRRVAEENVRQERQHLVSDVRTVYYQISATEAGILALRDLVRAVEEVDSLTTRYHAEGTVLRADALEVKARLARERQRLAALENALDTQRERLNQLIGREVGTRYQVTKASDLVPRTDGSLEALRERARASRPEIRTYGLRAAQADTAGRIVRSNWIPDVSAVVSYTRTGNFQVLPDAFAFAGVYLTWEPFDWGRKSHEAAERAYQADRALQGQQEAQHQVDVEVGQRWRALTDAAALLEATRLEEEASTAVLDTDRNRYRESAAMLREVLRSEARLSGARRDFTDALAGYWSAVAELERAIGDDNT